VTLKTHFLVVKYLDINHLEFIWKHPLSGLWDLNAVTQGRPSRNRANLGLNEAIPSGLKDGALQNIDEQSIFIPPKTAKNRHQSIGRPSPADADMGAS
jgi:hypothetical protein